LVGPCEGIRWSKDGKTPDERFTKKGGRTMRYQEEDFPDAGPTESYRILWEKIGEDLGNRSQPAGTSRGTDKKKKVLTKTKPLKRGGGGGGGI